ncbi:MAG: glutamate/aspartate ABC transporter substrate-binding protein [Candidatus Protistobacter heckmanni]|nr:glutamate/aspartate ABC transporter substrate-binding protein [Candidatus Protistobacter heckmanni]
MSTYQSGARAARIVCLAAFASLLAGGVQAQETLKKIKDNGVISLGVRDSSIPFSYNLGGVRQVGYAYDIEQKVVDEVKAQLKLAKLEVKEIPVTSQNRIPLLQNGTVDLECGSTTNNIERQKQVSFSTTFFIVGTRLLTAKDSGVKDFPDLKGKTVVTTAGTTSERLIRKMNDEKAMGMNIVSAKDHGQSFLMLKSKRAVAFMMDDVLLYGERAKARNPGDWVVVGTAQSREAYGCMIRKDDASFKALVDGVITKLMKTEEIREMYKKWFLQPVPPKGLELGFALSPDMEELFKKPNDKAFE